MTRTQKDRAVRKIEIAIDKLIDLQDMGLGADDIERCLELLRGIQTRYENTIAECYGGNSLMKRVV